MSSAGSIVNAPSNLSDGVSSSERQSRTGEMLNSNVHGKYYDQTFRGKLFHCDFGVAATGIAVPTSGTATGVALFNPAGSGVNLSLISVRIGLVSGTLVLGTIVHAANTNVTAAASTGTAGVVTPGLIGSSAAASGKPLYTVTLPAAPTVFRVFFYKQPTIATGNSFILEDLVDGQIAVAPGATWSLMTIGADTTPLMKISVSWEEISI